MKNTILYIFLLPLSLIGQTKKAQLDSLSMYLYNTNQFTGSVLIMENDSTVFKKSFGWADFEKKDTLTTHSPINLASLSKHITATAILLLIQDGKIEIEDAVNKFIPEFPYPHIKVKHLLYHTSGLQDYEGLTAIFNRKSKRFTNEELVDLYAKKNKKLKFTPGSRHLYSNTGYVILATIVERISGQSFSEFLQNRIFSPCSMTDAYVYNIDSLQNYEHIVWSYTPGYKRADQTLSGKHFRYYDRLTGDGAVCLSVDDFEKWTYALHRHTLVSDSLFQLSVTSGKLSDGTPVHYGFGWDLIDGNYGHTGGWHNYTTYYFNDSKNNRTYCVLMTNNPKNYDAIIRAFRDIMEGKKSTFPLPVFRQKRKQKKFEKKYKINYE